MPVNVTWAIEQHVIEGQYIGDVTIDEAEIAIQQTLTLMQQSDVAEIHILVNLEAAGALPTRLSALRKLSAPLFQQTQLGWFIVCGINSPVVHLMANLLAQIFKHRYKSTKTRAEALALLRGLDRTLELAE